MSSSPSKQQSVSGSFGEVLWAFLKLGMTSFGGPVAHLGYFRTEFVERRRWLDDAAYSQLVALCQFLPGPASSQVGIALGFGRAGWRGALAAWLGFTLPSAVLLVVLASSLPHWRGVAQDGAIHGLLVAAVAIVAQAVWGMAKSLCPDPLRAGMAVTAALLVLAIPSAMGQMLALLGGGLWGWWVLRVEPHRDMANTRVSISSRAAVVMLCLFTVLLAGSWVLEGIQVPSWLAAVRDFYQAGALVFGGGHVVLPLLQSSVAASDGLSHDVFLAGYGAAQAVPGPLFTLAAYVGALMPAPLGGWWGGAALLLAIFLPAWLLVLGALPFWQQMRQHARMHNAVAGINAVVVGVLGAALYDPVWTHAIHSKSDLGLALAAFGLLAFAKWSPVYVVSLAALAGWYMAL